jgi:superfamily II DNA/RNA helicase
VLLQEREQEQLAQQLQQDLGSAEGSTAAAAAAGESSQQQGKQAKGPLRALILTPTRELALQVGCGAYRGCGCVGL